MRAAGDGNCLLNAFNMGLQFQTSMYDLNIHTPHNLRIEIYNYINSSRGASLRNLHHMTDNEVFSILSAPGQRPSDLDTSSHSTLNSASNQHQHLQFVL
jgi:hypothetical protein